MSCQEQAHVEPNLHMVEVAIPDAYKPPANARYTETEMDDVTVDIQVTLENGEVVTGKARLVMPNDETLSYFALSSNIMEAADLAPDFWVNDTSTNGARVMGCFENCRNKYVVNGEKRDGFGACKADCWLDLVIVIIVIVAL